jgi:hypothetical protein
MTLLLAIATESKNPIEAAATGHGPLTKTLGTHRDTAASRLGGVHERDAL